MNSSVENMYAFYRAVGETEQVSLHENICYEAVTAHFGNWPQILFWFKFGNKIEENVRLTLSELAIGDSRMVAICNANDLLLINQDKLRKENIFPVEVWETMQINFDPGLKAELLTGFEPHKLVTQKQLADFTELVNLHMLREVKISETLFPLLSLNKQFEFYGVYSEGKLISGLMTFSTQGTSGLYFIVTRIEMRGHGIAEYLIRKTIHRLFEKEIENVVLQAVGKAVNLYRRIGFQPTGKLVLLTKN
jgi:ribosomal protein S18 acetylase RimI-like enzyme